MSQCQMCHIPFASLIFVLLLKKRSLSSDSIVIEMGRGGKAAFPHKGWDWLFWLHLHQTLRDLYTPQPSRLLSFHPLPPGNGARSVWLGVLPSHTSHNTNCGKRVLSSQCSPSMQCSDLLSPALWLKELGCPGALCLLAHQFFHPMSGAALRQAWG